MAIPDDPAGRYGFFPAQQPLPHTGTTLDSLAHVHIDPAITARLTRIERMLERILAHLNLEQEES